MGSSRDRDLPPDRMFLSPRVALGVSRVVTDRKFSRVSVLDACRPLARTHHWLQRGCALRGGLRCACRSLSSSARSRSAKQASVNLGPDPSRFQFFPARGEVPQVLDPGFFICPDPCGQFSTIRSGNTGPAPRSFELLEGNLGWKQAMTLGF